MLYVACCLRVPVEGIWARCLLYSTIVSILVILIIITSRNSFKSLLQWNTEENTKYTVTELLCNSLGTWLWHITKSYVIVTTPFPFPESLSRIPTHTYPLNDILCDAKSSVAVCKTLRNGLSTWPWHLTKCFVTDCSRDLGCFTWIPQASCVPQVRAPIFVCWGRLTITWLMFWIDHSRAIHAIIRMIVRIIRRKLWSRDRTLYRKFEFDLNKLFLNNNCEPTVREPYCNHTHFRKYFLIYIGTWSN